MSDKEYELLSKGVVIAWDEGLMTKEEMERALAHLDALAAAEQRAATTEAALATLLEHLPSDEVLSESWQGDMYWEDIFALAEIVPIYRAALSAPATQPDARAAAERAIVDKGRVWQTAEDRLRAEEERQGVDDPDAYLALSNDAEDARDDLLCVLRATDATDGAPKETT